MTRNFDAIVVGARCAGSPTAMLLARRGCRVLLIDRATFPSDTISTHVIQPLGAAKLASWGLLDKLIRTGCPAIGTYSFDFGPIKLSGSPGTTGAPNGYCARRTILDKLLIDAAVEAGAELREGFSISELLIDDGRVVGVRGRSSDRRTGRGARQDRHRRRRTAVARSRSGTRRELPSETGAARAVLLVLEQPADAP